MPGKMALKPLRRSRWTCGSERRERLLSATKSIEPGGAAASMASSTSSNRTPKLGSRSEEHTSELQSQSNLVCRLLLEKKKKKVPTIEESISNCHVMIY